MERGSQGVRPKIIVIYQDVYLDSHEAHEPVVACCGSATGIHYCELFGHTCSRNSENAARKSAQEPTTGGRKPRSMARLSWQLARYRLSLCHAHPLASAPRQVELGRSRAQGLRSAPFQARRDCSPAHGRVHGRAGARARPRPVLARRSRAPDARSGAAAASPVARLSSTRTASISAAPSVLLARVRRIEAEGSPRDDRRPRPGHAGPGARAGGHRGRRELQALAASFRRPGLAVISFKARDWSKVGPGKGRLEQFVDAQDAGLTTLDARNARLDLGRGRSPKPAPCWS